MRSLSLLLAGILLLSSCTTEATRKAMDGGVSESGSSSGADVSSNAEDPQDAVANDAQDGVTSSAQDGVTSSAQDGVTSSAQDATADAVVAPLTGESPVVAEKSSATDTASAKTGTKPAPSAGESTAKPGASLVNVRAELAETSATVEIFFSAPARDVNVRVWGTDGLEVTSETNPIASKSYERGEAARLTVKFAAPTNRCDLAVGVSGEFAGRKRSLVRSFTVHPDGDSPDQADIRTDAQGRQIRIIKSGE